MFANSVPDVGVVGIDVFEYLMYTDVLEASTVAFVHERRIDVALSIFVVIDEGGSGYVIK